MDKDGASTLAVILGAQAFPKFPDLKGGEAFAASARAFEKCLASQFGADWKQSHLLNLFDSADMPGVQLKLLRSFCAARAESQRLLVYYVGHGGFFGGQNYYLALHGTEKGDECYSGLEIRNVAFVLDQCFPGKRVVLILDCCFAAEAMAQFQDAGAVSRAVESGTFNAFPASGTSLLCASSKDDMALWQGTGERTMFSECLADVLTSGIPGKGERLNLRDVSEAVETLVRTRFGHKGVRPEVHSPRQRGADVAVEPLFRNVAYKPPEPKTLPANATVALRNPLPQVRMGGITALSHLAETADEEVLGLVRDQLQGMAERDDSLSVREAARLALDKLGQSGTSDERPDTARRKREDRQRAREIEAERKAQEERLQLANQARVEAERKESERRAREKAERLANDKAQQEFKPTPKTKAEEAIPFKRRPEEALAIVLTAGATVFLMVVLTVIGLN